MDTNHSEEPLDEVITAKDPKRVAQGKWLASVSRKAKKDKLRKEIMEEDFSYLPYILYPLAGVSTFLLFVSIFIKRKEVIKYEYIPTTIDEKSKNIESKDEKSNYETFG